jgi:tRNA nucleotidyltransferase (CCA-adding enzyme)
MFYNLSAGGKVEDLSGKGLDDLKNGYIRTPLPPLTTFKDDPLRVMRAIRFAGRFGFRVDPELAKAAADPQVAADLLTKVSRERFGIELNKMLSGIRGAKKPIPNAATPSHSSMLLIDVAVPVLSDTDRPTDRCDDACAEQKSAYSSFKLLCDYGLRHIVFHVGDFKSIGTSLSRAAVARDGD